MDNPAETFAAFQEEIPSRADLLVSKGSGNADQVALQKAHMLETQIMTLTFHEANGTDPATVARMEENFAKSVGMADPESTLKPGSLKERYAQLEQAYRELGSMQPSYDADMFQPSVDTAKTHTLPAAEPANDMAEQEPTAISAAEAQDAQFAAFKEHVHSGADFIAQAGQGDTNEAALAEAQMLESHIAELSYLSAIGTDPELVASMGRNFARTELTDPKPTTLPTGTLAERYVQLEGAYERLGSMQAAQDVDTFFKTVEEAKRITVAPLDITPQEHQAPEASTSEQRSTTAFDHISPTIQSNARNQGPSAASAVEVENTLLQEKIDAAIAGESVSNDQQLERLTQAYVDAGVTPGKHTAQSEACGK